MPVQGAVDLPEHKEVVQQYGAEDISQRARDLNVSVAVCACMVMRQSPAIYRRIFQPCPVVVAYVCLPPPPLMLSTTIQSAISNPITCAHGNVYREYTMTFIF